MQRGFGSALDGEIVRDTLVRKGEDGNWVTADKVRGLLDRAHEAPASKRDAVRPLVANNAPPKKRFRPHPVWFAAFLTVWFAAFLIAIVFVVIPLLRDSVTRSTTTSPRTTPIDPSAPVASPVVQQPKPVSKVEQPKGAVQAAKSVAKAPASTPPNIAGPNAYGLVYQANTLRGYDFYFSGVQFAASEAKGADTQILYLLPYRSSPVKHKTSILEVTPKEWKAGKIMNDDRTWSPATDLLYRRNLEIYAALLRQEPNPNDKQCYFLAPDPRESQFQNRLRIVTVQANSRNPRKRRL